MSDGWRWWAVAILPRWFARWLFRNVDLGSWAPYVAGHALNASGVDLATKVDEIEALVDEEDE